MSLSDYRTGLADALGNLSGVQVYRVPPDAVNPLAVIVAGFDITGDTLGGSTATLFTVLAVASRKNTDQIDRLDELCEWDTGIRSVLEEDPTLGGNCDDCAVTSVGEYGEIEIGDTVYYGARITGVIV